MPEKTYITELNKYLHNWWVHKNSKPIHFPKIFKNCTLCRITALVHVLCMLCVYVCGYMKNMIWESDEHGISRLAASSS